MVSMGTTGHVHPAFIVFGVDVGEYVRCLFIVSFERTCVTLTFREYLMKKGRGERIILVVSWILKISFLMAMLSGIFTGDYILFLRGILPMFIVVLPFLLEKYYDIVTPAFLDLIITLAFFFHQSGVVYGIYTTIPSFDMFTHAFSSIVLATSVAVIFYLLDSNIRDIRLNRGIMALLIVTVTVTFGVIWEMGEALVDILHLLPQPAQESLADTMQDLSFDMLGSILVAAGYLWSSRSGTFQRGMSRTDESVKRLVESYSKRRD